MWQKRPKKASQKPDGQQKPRWPYRAKVDYTRRENSDDSAESLGTYLDDGLNSEEDDAPVITVATVRDRAIRLLANREHGRKELEEKLLQRELPHDLIIAALDKLAEEGLQCDIRFAESYTRMRINRGHGANKVRADLQARHLHSSITEDAIKSSGADWITIAFDALEKKFGREVGAGFKMDFETRAKLQRFLYRRGFELSELQSAIAQFEAASSRLENEL